MLSFGIPLNRKKGFETERIAGRRKSITNFMYRYPMWLLTRIFNDRALFCLEFINFLIPDLNFTFVPRLGEDLIYRILHYD